MVGSLPSCGHEAFLDHPLQYYYSHTLFLSISPLSPLYFSSSLQSLPDITLCSELLASDLSPRRQDFVLCCISRWENSNLQRASAHICGMKLLRAIRPSRCYSFAPFHRRESWCPEKLNNLPWLPQSEPGFKSKSAYLPREQVPYIITSALHSSPVRWLQEPLLLLCSHWNL